MCGSDADGDGYSTLLLPPLGCSVGRDCDDGNSTVNPSSFEDLTSPVDDNCNARTGMLPLFADGTWAASQWALAGKAALLGDSLEVGDSASAASGTATRTLGIPLPVSVYVAVDVGMNTGSGASCKLRLATAAGPAPAPVSWSEHPILGTGEHLYNFHGLIATGRLLRQIQVSCSGNRRVRLDWLQVQDADEIFPPPNELSLTWQDTRHPGGGLTTSVVAADDGFGGMYIGSDVAGIGRWSTGGFTVANGSGADSLMMSNGMAVVGIMPVWDNEGEVYALLGDQGADGGTGGLWWSGNAGDSWEVLAVSEAEFPPGNYPATTDDDVGGANRETNCGDPDNPVWAHGGGLLLQSQSIPAASGDIVYIANADADARGVSVYDPTTGDVCRMENDGDPLPEQPIGAILRVDALPNETPALVVGYRAPEGGAAAIYVCALPAPPERGVDCDSGTGFPATCQEVDAGLLGVDVRDLEWDAWSANQGEVLDETGVLIADGGWRPPTSCEAEGLDYGGLHELWITDAAGVGLLDVSADVEIATSADLLDLTLVSLTGISMDPSGEYIVVHAPPGGSRYYRDRGYRVRSDQLLGAAGAPAWEALNSGEDLPPAFEYADVYELEREAADLDLGGAWLESEFNGRAAPFPARFAPGQSFDSIWVDLPAPFNDQAFFIAGNGGWMVQGLAAAWTDNETLFAEPLPGPPDGKAQPEGDLSLEFMPNINVQTHQSYQSNVMPGGALIARDGHIWSGAGDQGPLHLDATSTSTAWNPNGSAMDCLWDGWNAGAKSVTVAERHYIFYENEEAAPPVIWATLGDQSESGFPHEIAVVRTMDQGATWEYAGAGWQFGTSVMHKLANELATTGDADYGHRACADLDGTHVAVPFGADDVLGSYVGAAHAFSLATGTEDPREMTFETLGNPNHIRALNDLVALVNFTPTGSSLCWNTSSCDTQGGLRLTVDGGKTWLPVPFENNASNSCSELATYAGESFELIHPGVDSVWEPDPLDSHATGSTTLDLLVRVQGTSDAGDCALARVVVAYDSTLGVAASWDWIPLPAQNSYDWSAPAAAPGQCGVSPSVIEAATPAPWADVAMLTGAYGRTFQSTSSNKMSKVAGGACMLDLNTFALTMVVDPRTSVYGVEVAAPHPQVADLWMLIPELGEGSAKECREYRYGPLHPYHEMECDVPYPLIVRGNATGFQVTELPELMPTSRPNTAMWSEINVPDDSADGEGNWIVVATQGAGTWRGEFTW